MGPNPSTHVFTLNDSCSCTITANFVFPAISLNSPSPALPSSYPNHQTHRPTDVNPSNNAVSQEIVRHSRPPRSHRNPFQTPRQGQTETIPWATIQRAMENSLDYILSRNMTVISGEVQCKKCEKVYNIEYDLEQKFREIAAFISENRSAMHDRAESMDESKPS
ncbi:uncharacterized protein LOC111311062 [Durio zibethinus]|uniref:Uncharacterized protein LOC111311062 n=1 Tax=Durio zibethinus TaxID=66656 RepID=A0A6P6AMZ7_DURZI|nr:uncharacterized protein LOC111311062 [Durio zibethinus]